MYYRGQNSSTRRVTPRREETPLEPQEEKITVAFCSNCQEKIGPNLAESVGEIFFRAHENCSDDDFKVLAEWIEVRDYNVEGDPELIEMKEVS